MKILIIEDNNEISEMLATILAADYTVQQAYSGTEGLLLFQQDAFDLILLDRMLPGKDGTQVLQEIRQTSTVPVIILTALDEPADVSTLLLAGANDYLTKPFNVEELKARIIVQLRTNKQAPPVASSLSYKNIQLLPDSFQLQRGEATVQLKKKEFEIFSLLLANPKKFIRKKCSMKLFGKNPITVKKTRSMSISAIYAAKSKHSIQRKRISILSGASASS